MTQKRSQSTIIFDYWTQSLQPLQICKVSYTTQRGQVGISSSVSDPFCKVTMIFRRTHRFQPYLMYLLGTRGIEHNEKKTYFPEFADHIVEITTIHLLATPIMKER